MYDVIVYFKHFGATVEDNVHKLNEYYIFII